MRYIDPRNLELPPGWANEALKAREVIASLESGSRPAATNARSGIWTKLKPSLERLSRKKCWYCESREIRSDKHVDHFRPKNRVCDEDSPGHPGYWWLAFRHENYRYSCTYCNSKRKDLATGGSGGKADRFPIRDETKRSWGGADPIVREEPVLLDPTDPGDPVLLWFDDDGFARPTFTESQAQWKYKRAKDSVEIYHLDHTDLKEARLAISEVCRQRVLDADAFWRDVESGEPTGELRFTSTVRELAKMLASDAEFSRAARCTLMGMRGDDRPWLEAVLSA